ncbi:MAG: hypothetical protein JNL75_04930 [Chitinophagales bacterium]|nr:hypothetical protein [Chitinophagales bacterium]
MILKTQNYHQKLEPNEIYHLFSRANGSELMFQSNENYLYFLKKLDHHTASIAKIYAYSLLPNHFHLLVRINDFEYIIEQFEIIKKRKFNSDVDVISDFIIERFSNLLNGYTKAFNKMYHRKGALFIDYIKRSKSESEIDFVNFIWYIHKNAVHHGYTKKVGDWKYDSYSSLIDSRPSKLLREEVISFFGDKNAFIDFHDKPIDLKNIIIDI